MSKGTFPVKIQANPLTCIRRAKKHLDSAYNLAQSDHANALPECIQAINLIRIAMDNLGNPPFEVKDDATK